LFFVDADVVIAQARSSVSGASSPDIPSRRAVFGSYDARPSDGSMVSRYRNLLHHFVHQRGNPEASTFWAGCGAIRRSVFHEVGGFDAGRFRRASIEDIELGYRLRAQAIGSDWIRGSRARTSRGGHSDPSSAPISRAGLYPGRA